MHKTKVEKNNGTIKLTLLDKPEDHVVLLLVLKGHQVHAVLPADVPGVQPVDLLVGMGWHVGAKEEVASSVLEFLRP